MVLLESKDFYDQSNKNARRRKKLDQSRDMFAALLALLAMLASLASLARPF
jgi:hypothetical protein